MRRIVSESARTPEPPAAQSTLTWIAALAGLGACWFLFAGQITIDDALIGAGGLLLTAIVAQRLARLTFARFRPRRRWLSPARSLPAQVVHDSGVVTAVLARRLAGRDPQPGRLSAAPFPATGEGSRQAARRALVVLLTSFAPNTYVAHVDPDTDRIFYHELKPQGKTPDTIRELESP